MKKIWRKVFLSSLAIALGYQGARFLARKIIHDVSTDAISTIMTDLYDENLWEFVSATTKFGPQVIVETNLRSQEGQMIKRPLGSPKKFPSLDQLMFNIGQLHIMPTPLEQPVDTKVVIGKNCKYPLIIDLPIMVSGMAFGAALSEKAKVALAKGASMANTATNTGEGPFLPSERKAAKKLILQYNRGNWNKSDDILKQADAIEIQIGQGATGGTGQKYNVGITDFKLAKGFGVLPAQDAVLHARHAEVSTPSELPKLVQKLKSVAGDIPIGVKFGAGKYLEMDMKWAIDAGVDFITIDGAEAATKGSAPILQDDFGIPTIFAINRAAQFLQKQNCQDRISLIAAGKIRTPGDVLKVLALGADAAYIGAIALFAMSHTQVLKPIPFEPPTQLVYYDGKYADKFDIASGAKNLAKFLKSCNDELIEGIRALGKTSVGEVNKDDLIALDDITAKGVGVPLAYEPCITPNIYNKKIPLSTEGKRHEEG
ncbi:FMN-binding glutamate synthase family protein [Thermincola potens]|uniref:Ferredoxin-dependent glutamate synthase n=1 Tax=Thermincola potens (strain JR) TaxID=635013 RepID=D5XDY6_THEPJ|nr:FMN-binding glutamate synthase family protein [Thermincola potens]ADG81857.1 ferredoxin-dependent glutamate synthase [Thermincola potens JR]